MILEVLYTEINVSIPSLIPAKISRCPLLLESADSEQPRLSNSEIILEEFQTL